MDRRTLPALVTIALAACGNGASSKSASIEVFGKKPVPPGDLAKVTPNLTQAQIKSLFPTARPTPNHSGSPSLSIASGYSNLDYRIGFYSDKDAVADVIVKAPKALAAQLDQVWGAPTTVDPGGPTWVNTDEGYEVHASDMGRDTWVSYRPFVPFSAAFLGPTPGLVDALTKIKLGMTRAQVTAAVPGLEGAPKGGGSYIPYEAAAKGVTLVVSFDADDKVDAMKMEVPEGGAEVMVKAWGKPPRTVKPYPNDATEVLCWESADGALSIAATPGTRSMPVDFTAKGAGLCRPE
jgi:hypothetical protein